MIHSNGYCKVSLDLDCPRPRVVVRGSDSVYAAASQFCGLNGNESGRIRVFGGVVFGEYPVSCSNGRTLSTQSGASGCEPAGWRGAIGGIVIAAMGWSVLTRWTQAPIQGKLSLSLTTPIRGVERGYAHGDGLELVP